MSANYHGDAVRLWVLRHLGHMPPGEHLSVDANGVITRWAGPLERIPQPAVNELPSVEDVQAWLRDITITERRPA